MQKILYARLVRAFPGRVVFAHVPLSRVLDLDALACQCSADLASRELAASSADFVLCASDFRILAAIGLEERCAGAAAPPRFSPHTQACLHRANIACLALDRRNLPTEAQLKALLTVSPRSSAWRAPANAPESVPA